MGVVHKLRDDIVDFILAQKKARPEISVRKLSEVVLKQFKIVVSKSSVSTVLKNASLNSPIGRHGFSGDEIADGSKKSAGTFKIPEHKKKQIFPASKISTIPSSDKPAFSSSKVIKTENTPGIKKETKEIQLEGSIKPVPTKIEKRKLAPEMSNLKTEKNVFPEIMTSSFENAAVRHPWAGMIFLKAAEWELAGGSILAKIFKDELGGRFDIDYEFLADLLLFPEMFDHKASAGEEARRIEKLFSAGNKAVSFDLQAFSVAMAAVNQIEDCGLKIAIELEILLRGVSSVRLTNKAGKNIFYHAKNKIVNLENVQSEGIVSVKEAMEVFNTEITKNVHSAVFHYFSNTALLEDVIVFLLSAFGSHPDNGLKEAVFYDGHGSELVQNTYFPPKSRSFVLAVWDCKKIWPETFISRSEGEFAVLPVLGKTFYYKEIAGEQMFKSRKRLVRTIILSTSPVVSDEPLVVLLTNVDGEGEKLNQAVLDFLYSWPGLTEEIAPYFMLENAENNNLIAGLIKEIQAQAALAQCLPALRRFFDGWSWHRFFAPAGAGSIVDDKAIMESIARLPGHIRNENERLIVVTLEVPASNTFFEQLKNAVRRFNARMFNGIGGHRIILKLSSVPT